MAEKALYVLAEFDENTAKTLTGLQKILYAAGFSGTQTKDIPPHFTLASFPVEQEAEIVRRLRETAEMAEAVMVVFTHLSVFSGGRVLFASPAANGRMFSLRQKFGTDEAWTPHATLLIDEPEEIIRALALVLRHFSAFYGQIRALSLYEFFPARLILTVELGAASEIF